MDLGRPPKLAGPALDVCDRMRNTLTTPFPRLVGGVAAHERREVVKSLHVTNGGVGIDVLCELEITGPHSADPHCDGHSPVASTAGADLSTRPQ